METIHLIIRHWLQYAHLHPNAGKLFAFISAFLESLPIIGTIVPGTITMTAVGTLIGTGILPLIITLTIASIGALTGDIIGFWCGRHFKYGIPRRWPFKKYPNILKHGKAFFKKHGGKSIIIGRFIGPARSTIPMIAGLLNMSWGKFIIAAIPSAVLWAIIYTIPGILLGALSTELPAKKMTVVIAIGIGVIILLWLIVTAIKQLSAWISGVINNKVDALWQALNARNYLRFITKWITNQQHPRNHHQLTRLLIAIVCGAIAIISYVLAALHTSYTNINLPWFYFLQSIRNYNLDSFFIIMSFIGRPVVLVAITCLITLILYLRKQRRAAIHLILLIAVASAATTILKHLSHSPRPTGFNFIDTSSSLPSGHTCLTICFYGFLALLTNDLLKKSRHNIGYILVALLTALVSIARIYLGMHWMTDIITSIFLGLSLLLIAFISYRRLPNTRSKLHLPLKTWFSITLTSIFLVVLTYAASHFNISRYQHTPFNRKINISQLNWWQSPLRHIPVFRANRFGHLVAPLNIQWHASINTITKKLKQQGWYTSTRSQTHKKNITAFTQKHIKYHIPILPILFQNNKPILVASKPSKNQTLLLYLWPTHIRFNNSKTPLWVGSIYKYKAHHAKNYSTQWAVKFAAISRKKTVHIKTALLPTHAKRLIWNHKILMLR